MKDTIFRILWAGFRALCAALILSLIGWCFHNRHIFWYFVIEFIAAAVLFYIIDKRKNS